MRKESEQFLKNIKKVGTKEFTSEELDKERLFFNELKKLGLIEIVAPSEETKVAVTLSERGMGHFDKDRWYDKKSIVAIIVSSFISLSLILLSNYIQVELNVAQLEMVDLDNDPRIVVSFQNLTNDEYAENPQICLRNKGLSDSGRTRFSIEKEGLTLNYGNIPDIKAGKKEECDSVFLTAERNCIRDGNCLEILTKDNKANLVVECYGCKPAVQSIPIEFCVSHETHKCE